MLVPNQKVKVKWNSCNKAKYVSMGYKFTKMGDTFDVDINDAMDSRSDRIQYRVICDYCGKEYTVRASNYWNNHNEFGDACCHKCGAQKAKKTNIKKYGYETALLNEEVKDKVRQTNIKKYGCENVMQNKDIQKKAKETTLKHYGVEYPLQNSKILDKAKQTCLDKYGYKTSALNEDVIVKRRQTCLKKYGCDEFFGSEKAKLKIIETNMERYGCEYPMQNKDILEKQKNTNIDKYGVSCSLHNEDIQKKVRETCIEKYGCLYPMQNEEIRTKARNSLYINGTIPTSKQQLVVFDMCKKMYGGENVSLNKPLSSFSLDIQLKYNNNVIDIEYDGRYWHQDEQRDRRRDEFVKSWGYKVLRIRANHSIPTEEQLTEAIDYLSKEGNDFTTIELDI